VQGGVGVAMGLYDVNVVFVNAHMASKKPDMRRAQYCELVDRLGAKLGGRGFGLNEEFHHVVWMGDLNYHCKGVTAREALAMISSGNHMQLLLDHDELLDDKENETAFYEYEEPLMAPRFFPTYKKIPARGKVNYRSPSWVDTVYVTKFKVSATMSTAPLPTQMHVFRVIAGAVL
jgi:endonuclease/exonuclease/phosphatase family metal-dependent hydrolase